ncbi:MAG: PilZ domain-containing protein [Proteobacteria bacterium]|nr:PilZ domain-containing protein [Pseudomonadota bacterium]MBU1716153.1 PilZ domain-containing protein [Pseudomonadota bacterium]
MSDEKNWDDIPSLNLEMDSSPGEKVKSGDNRSCQRMDAESLKNLLEQKYLSLPIRISTRNLGVFDGIILDISKSGVRISIPKALMRGELVKVGFNLNNQTIYAKSVVKWGKKAGSGVGFEVGMEFREVSSGGIKFIETLSSAHLFRMKDGGLKF